MLALFPLVRHICSFYLLIDAESAVVWPPFFNQKGMPKNNIVDDVTGYVHPNIGNTTLLIILTSVHVFTLYTCKYKFLRTSVQNIFCSFVCNRIILNINFQIKYADTSLFLGFVILSEFVGTLYSDMAFAPFNAWKYSHHKS